MSHRYTNKQKTAALRELENAHFDAGAWDTDEDGDYGPVAIRAHEASNRLREMLGLPLVRELQPKAAAPSKKKPRLEFVYVGVDRRFPGGRRWSKTYKLAGEPGSHTKTEARAMAKGRGAVAVFVG